MAKEKSTRGNASQFFVAGELCRRGYSALVTLGNTPNTDVLCRNLEGTKFVHIQVKTYKPGNSKCSVGPKAEKNFGNKFFWVLCGLPETGQLQGIEYYIFPASIMSQNVKKAHELWLKAPGKKGQQHNETTMRTVHIPPYKSFSGWSISRYKNRWDLIEEKLKDG